MIDSKTKRTMFTMFPSEATEMCDYYCKFPEAYEDDEDGLNEICEDCPLGRERKGNV